MATLFINVKLSPKMALSLQPQDEKSESIHWGTGMMFYGRVNR